MNRYTYDRGTWKDGMEFPDLGSDERVDEYFERIGFSLVSSRYGSKDGVEFEVRESKDGCSFMAQVAPTGNCLFAVHLPDFPSLMQFLKDFGPTFTVSQLQTDFGEASEAFRKLFRAYHGHDAFGFCRQCDPAAWESAQIYVRQLQSDGHG